MHGKLCTSSVSGLRRLNLVTVHPWKRKQKHHGGRGYSVFFRNFCGNYLEGKGFLDVYRPSSGTEVYISRQWNKPPSKNSTSSWRRFVKTLFLNISLGTKQLTSRKRSCITLNSKLAALPLSRSMGNKRLQSRRWRLLAKRVFDLSAEGQGTVGTIQICIVPTTLVYK